ncbi:DUF6221 family protein [Nonomuraea pusilla]|uniref:DUF6221 family protein n=1 Tax=Nonomuraea pusilla TaxID=46177 RepID=UPI00331C697E
MASDDLTAFLRARYDEDERAATHARGTVPVRRPGDVRPFRRQDEQTLDIYSAVFRPERILADVAAKRRILHEHAIVHREIGWLEDGDEDNAEIPVCRSCVPKHSWYGSRADVPEGPCRTVRLLALPYADLNSYREEWKP